MKINFLLSCVFILCLSCYCYALDSPPITIICHNIANKTVNKGSLVMFQNAPSTTLSGKASFGFKVYPGNSTSGALGVCTQTCANNTLCNIAIEGVTSILIDQYTTTKTGNTTIPGDVMYGGRTDGKAARVTGNNTGAEIIGYALEGNKSGGSPSRIFIKIGRRN